MSAASRPCRVPPGRTRGGDRGPHRRRHWHIGVFPGCPARKRRLALSARVHPPRRTTLATVAAPSPSSQARAAYPAAGTTTTTDDWTVPAHRSASDWSDRETGLMAAAVVGALGLV